MESMKKDDTTAVISDLREQIKRLESKLESIDNHGKPDSMNEVSGFNEVDDSASGSHGIDTDAWNNISYLPTINKCNFTDFKNRFSEEDSRNAVDVLESGNLFEQEYRSVQALREKLFEHGKSNIPLAKLKQETKTLVRETDRTNAALRNDQSDCTWIRRIRLQAPALLQLLAKVQGESWSNRPRTYGRPFCTLIHFHPQVKLALAELEEKWTTQSEEHPTDSARMTPDDDDRESLDDDGLDDSEAALDILRVYVKFIDEEVIPESLRYDNLDYQSEEKILFSDLCYIFKPGEYIYMQIEGEQSTGHDYRMGQRIWRVYFVNDAIRSYNLTPADHRKYSTAEPTEDDGMYFTVHCYHIDYTGDEFCVVTNTFRIPPYDKWRPINSLPIYPIRFNPNHQKYMDNSLRIGEQVLRFVESKHAFYSTSKPSFIMLSFSRTLEESKKRFHDRLLVCILICL
jgi:hypothetical protein